MIKRTKIVQVCAIDETMDKLLKTLNIELIENKYDVIGVCSKGKLKKCITDTGVRVEHIKIDRKINVLENMKTIYNLYKFFKEENPEIVHVHTPVAAVLGRLSAKLAKVPIIIYTAHGFYFHENMPKFKYKLFLNIEKFMARNFTDYIFTQSMEDLDTGITNNFKNKNKMEFIGNGIDVKYRFNPNNIKIEEKKMLYDSLDIVEDELIVTFVGRIVEEKGILDLLKAYEYTKNKVKFIIVGDIFQGDRDTQIIKHLKAYKNNENIKFLGNLSNVEKILSITDIFCLPSYREGMPRSIIEAMAMKCAVIATNVRGSREEVLDGETGFLVSLKSPKDIAEKIDILFNNKDLLENMKCKGRERALQLYDENRVINKQIDTMRELKEKRGFL